MGAGGIFPILLWKLTPAIYPTEKYQQPQSTATSTAHLLPRPGTEALNGAGHFVQGKGLWFTGQVQKVHHKIESRKSLKEKDSFNLTRPQIPQKKMSLFIDRKI